MKRGKPAKLRDGTWGAYVKGTPEVGERVVITASTGEYWDALVSDVVWTGRDDDGGDLALCGTVRIAVEPVDIHAVTRGLVGFGSIGVETFDFWGDREERLNDIYGTGPFP